MERDEIIKLIKTKNKSTLVKAFIQSNVDLEFKGVKVFGDKSLYLVIGDYSLIKDVIDKNKENIVSIHIDIIKRNSNIDLLNYIDVNARIEPGAIIREKAKIKDGAIILMGAIINIGAEIGTKTMIDMNAVIGSNSIIGNNVHIGAGAVIAGVLEPPSSTPTIIEDDVFVGANAVVLEGVRIGRNSIVGAGAVVTKNVEPNSIVVGVPARVVGENNRKEKVKLEGDLR